MTAISWEERLEELARRLRTLLDEDGPGAVAIAVSSLQAPDVAHALTRLDDEDRHRLFRALPNDLAGLVLEELPAEHRDDLLEEISDERLLGILRNAAADDAVFFLDQLDEDRAEHLLTHLDVALRQQLEEQWELPDDAVGRVMTRDIMTLRHFTTAGQALEAMRRRAKPYEGSLYIVDAENCLVGALSLRDIVIADPRSTVSHIMAKDPLKVRLDSDAGDAAAMMQRYHMRGLAVVDGENRLVGQLTWDDAVDLIEAGAQEEMLALAGTREDPDENPTVLHRALRRLPFLLVTTLGGFGIARIIGAFEHTIGVSALLVGFMPLVPALGGNIGIQCSTVTLRAIATGELTPERVFSRSLREIATGLLLAVSLSVITGLGALMIAWGTGQPYGIAIVIPLAMTLALLLASVLGVSIPLLCDKYGIDPAIAAGPFITMLNDVFGVTIYLGVATVLLRFVM